MVEAIAAEPTDLRDWVLVSDGRDTWLGLPTSHDGRFGDLMRLEPAYAVLGGWNLTKTPEGVRPSCGRMVFPLEWMPSARAMFVRAQSIIPLHAFDARDLAGFVAAVAQAEAARKTLQAARSGLVTATEMPKPGMRQ